MVITKLTSREDYSKASCNERRSVVIQCPGLLMPLIKTITSAQTGRVLD